MKHETVLLKEAIDALNLKKDGIYVDATLGGGGHSEEILIRSKNCQLLAFDQDNVAILKAQERLKEYRNVTIIKGNFADLKEQLQEREITQIDGIIFDLGLSAFQIDDASRGFSYLKNEVIDMRMDQDSNFSALDILNNYEYQDLVRIFFLYGEEKNSKKIAQKIISQRPLQMTSDLVKITDSVNYKESGHSAKRVFQALRIAVNKELEVLKKALNDSLSILKKNGRIVVISFHSLEDRIVKHFFKENSQVIIPKGLVIINKEKAPLEIITKKPIYPSKEEIAKNSRSRSAILRVAQKN